MAFKKSPRFRRALFSSAFVFGAATMNVTVIAQDASTYKTPPAPLQAIVDQLRAPSLNLSPRRDLAAMVKTPTLPSIRESRSRN
jgi:hypothetical protein